MPTEKAIMILLKKYDEAIKLYLEIEKIQPNGYSTASNIGTAYELIGQNKNALRWINKSVELKVTQDESKLICARNRCFWSSRFITFYSKKNTQA
jgi:tetratricopeptide (TPR) repeat protein